MSSAIGSRSVLFVAVERSVFSPPTTLYLGDLYPMFSDKFAQSLDFSFATMVRSIVSAARQRLDDGNG